MDAVKEIADGAIFLEGRNGTEAIELYKKEKPDIVFMDIVMPEKDGNEALSEIKAFDQDAVIIIVSSVGTQDQLKKAIQLGAKDFIQKPFEKNQISEIIELRLGGK
ncbi:MAG: response regulator [Pseudobutyrivibrio sp.]|nr:response regulator [Pseudobutyrivibrio sp.]